MEFFRGKGGKVVVAVIGVITLISVVASTFTV